MRRLLVLASAMIFFDVAFFSAIAPLLPDYVDDLGLSKAQAGILSAAYAAGTLLASLPAGFVASRLGPRRTVIFGLAAARRLQPRLRLRRADPPARRRPLHPGNRRRADLVGALTWLITDAPRRRARLGDRHRARHRGRRRPARPGARRRSPPRSAPSWSSARCWWPRSASPSPPARLPEAARPSARRSREVAATILSRPVLDATAFVAVPSVMFGAIEVLVPLRIDDLGGGHGLIAGGFIAGAALEAVLAPLAGRSRTGSGAARPTSRAHDLRAGDGRRSRLAQTLGVVLAALIVTSLGAGLCFAPALTLLSDIAESSRLHQGFAAGLSNMAWASGQVIGGVGGGVVASAHRQRGAQHRDRGPAAGHRRLRLPGDGPGDDRPAGRQARLAADGAWHRAIAARGEWVNWAGDQSLPAGARSSARATARSWPRRSRPPPAAGRRSASPARATPSPRRR